MSAPMDRDYFPQAKVAATPPPADAPTLGDVVARRACEHKRGTYRNKGDWRCRVCNSVVHVGRAG